MDSALHQDISACLGLHPELGREFDEKAEIPGNGLQVILSDRVWRARFGAAPDIVGRKITLNMQPFTVVGVMPAGRSIPATNITRWPMATTWTSGAPFTFEGDPTQRGSHYHRRHRTAEGRRHRSEQAQSEMNALMTQIAPRAWRDTAGWQVLVVPLYREVVGSSQRMLLVLLGAVGMVLLIACANAANLHAGAGGGRQREIAVRLALGARGLA